ncbi:MAG: FAD-dependent oxidoreductase [Deltaproteobacteria bacterium]|nr:FAD-dependent oxidoreductase [Deltaproteobacteria bacterium]
MTGRSVLKSTRTSLFCRKKSVYELLFPMIWLLLLPYEASGKNKRIGIIGGGIGGLATAAFLNEDPDLDVLLFEAEDHLGGNAITIQAKGKDQKLVSVDVGPQYACEKGWAEYLAIMKYYGIFDEESVHTMPGSIGIFSKMSNRDDMAFLSPRWNSFLKWKHMANAVRFSHFYDSSRKIYTSDNKDYDGETVSQWLQTLRIQNAFKQNVIQPFLASILGISFSELQGIAVSGLVKYFVFSGEWYWRKPLNIIKKGMGTSLVELGEKLHKVHFFMRSPVSRVESHSDGKSFLLHSGTGIYSVDEVVVAVHPKAAYSLLKSSSLPSEVLQALQDMSEREVPIFIHRDQDFLPRKSRFQSFLNIRVDKTGVTTTMKLNEIDASYGDILKSWIPDIGEREKLRSSPLLIAEKTFFHPKVTPEYIKAREHIRKYSLKENVHFAGAWSAYADTQNSGVVAAWQTARRLMRSDTKEFWTREIPSLKHIAD